MAARSDRRHFDIRLQKPGPAAASLGDGGRPCRGSRLVAEGLEAGAARRRLHFLCSAVRQMEALHDHAFGGPGGSTGGRPPGARPRHSRLQMAAVRTLFTACPQCHAVAPPFLLPDPGLGVHRRLAPSGRDRHHPFCHPADGTGLPFLGLRGVPEEVVEAGVMGGCTTGRCSGKCKYRQHGNR